MKKTRLLVPLALGLTLLLGASALAADEYSEHTYEVKDPSTIQAIEITDTDVPIEVRPSGGDIMRVSYFTSQREKYDITVDGGTLRIVKQAPLRIGIDWDFWNQEFVKMVLFLPDGYTGRLQIETADGDIRMDNIAATSAIITASDGDIHVSRSRFAGDMDIKTFDGHVRVDTIEAANLTAQTSDGDIFIHRPMLEGDLSCRAFDGDIEGTLTGSPADYTLTAKTVDGKSNVTSGGTGARRCDVQTVDGNIALFFEKN